MKNFILGGLVAAIALIACGWFVLAKGYIDFSANQPPSFVEAKFAMSAIDASTDRHAPDLKNPEVASEANLVAGAKLYLDHCGGCHGVPSNPDGEFARSFNPPVPGFFKDAPDMSENQNFYIIQRGIRWSGMPSWSSALTDQQIWQVVTFLSNIQKLPPAAQAVFGPAPGAAPMPMQMAPGMPMSQ
jgi:mono/diheme cytochrome c family protein